MKKPKTANNFNYNIEASYLLQDDSQLQRILDSRYEKATLNEIVQECVHLKKLNGKAYTTF